jgi:cell wall-associated NlpC family hydrolase
VLPEATAAVQAALAQVGKPYQWGAAGPNTFDCSGLTMWSWAQAGIAIPRVAADQQSWTTPVPISQLQPGDLVFFGTPAHHVGMYIGNGLMVDAPHTGADVTVESIWWSDLAGFGRVK